MSENKTYTGIGARAAPREATLLAYNLGIFLAKEGYVLRSGGANGMDSSFAEGARKAEGKMRIYLPWDSFNDNYYGKMGVYDRKTHFYPEPTSQEWKGALAISKDLLANRWESMGPPVRFLMARNVFQVLGLDLTSPSKFVICWTKDAKYVGGTSFAMRVADKYKVPVFNLGNESVFEKFTNRIKN